MTRNTCGRALPPINRGGTVNFLHPQYLPISLPVLFDRNARPIVLSVYHWRYVNVLCDSDAMFSMFDRKGENYNSHCPTAIERTKALVPSFSGADLSPATRDRSRGCGNCIHWPSRDVVVKRRRTKQQHEIWTLRRSPHSVRPFISATVETDRRDPFQENIIPFATVLRHRFALQSARQQRVVLPCRHRTLYVKCLFTSTSPAHRKFLKLPRNCNSTDA